MAASSAAMTMTVLKKSSRRRANGAANAGSTTQIEAVERHIPIANVIQFFHRSTKRGEEKRDDYQRMYDEGIQIALKYFGE
jgi:hypothetical protein